MVRHRAKEGSIQDNFSGERSKPAKPGLLEYAFWIFLFVAVGRIGQLAPALASIPLGKITIAFCILMLVIKWKKLPRLSSSVRPLARSLRLLVLITLLLTPFSIWRGASEVFLINQLPVLIAVTTIAYKMSRAWQSLRNTFLALVLCGAVLAGSALANYHGGRASTDTMYDTNDLAYLLVSIFPFSIGLAMMARNRLIAMGYWMLATGLAMTILLTQSRGGFLGLLIEAVLMLFMRIRVPASPSFRLRQTAVRMTSILAVACVAMIVWFHLPTEARTRLETIMDLGGDYNLDASDVTGRREIWKRGIEAALQRPLGYGPNTFSMVDLKFGGRFMAPHNSFIETLVELGVPGLILFVATYLFAWRALRTARRILAQRNGRNYHDDDQIVFARMLQVALFGNAVAGVFLSMAYSTVLWTLIGMSMAMAAIVNSQDAITDTTNGSLLQKSVKAGTSNWAEIRASTRY